MMTKQDKVNVEQSTTSNQEAGRGEEGKREIKEDESRGTLALLPAITALFFFSAIKL